MGLRRVPYVAGGYPFAVALVAVATLVLLPFRPVLTPTTVMLLYVPVIVGVARLSGVRPSAVAAVLSFLALDLLFIPPYYHLSIAALPEWVGLFVFLAVALLTGQQTGALRQREQAAVRRQNELELLNGLSARVASENSAESTAEFMVAEVARVIGVERAALYVGVSAQASPECLAHIGSPKPASGELLLVGWVLREGKAVGLEQVASLPPDQRPVSVSADAAIPGVSARGVYLPLQTADSLEGVLVAVPLGEAAMSADDERLLAAVANLLALSLHRQRLEEEAARTRALQEADRLKSTLVSSVSHELKTPLAAATARVTGLLDEGAGADADRVQSELLEVSQDLDRLNDSIVSLLDVSRLESDAWRPHFELHDVSEVLGTVYAQLQPARRQRVRFDIADDLPELSVDFAQLVRAITILVENALAYSPAGTPVVAEARHVDDEVHVAVTDAGPGVPDAEKALVFGKFYRGSAAASVPGGTGLGLAIALEIARTHGGGLRVEDVRPHGARFVLTLPVQRPGDTE